MRFDLAQLSLFVLTAYIILFGQPKIIVMNKHSLQYVQTSLGAWRGQISVDITVLRDSWGILPIEQIWCDVDGDRDGDE